jgi:hypothetical protein
MVVASYRSIFLFSDVVFNRASVSFRFSIRVFLLISGCACNGLLARPVVRPSPWRAPLAPHLPHARPLPLSISFYFSRCNTLNLGYKISFLILARLGSRQPAHDSAACGPVRPASPRPWIPGPMA